MEDSCFDAQQCVEKSLKSLCLFRNIKIPKTHIIEYLLRLLEDDGVKIPKYIKQAANLSDYSVETRYPGDYDEVNEREYKKTVKIAENVYNWVANKLNKLQRESRL